MKFIKYMTLLLPLGVMLCLTGCLTPYPEYSRLEPPIPATLPDVNITKQPETGKQLELTDIPWREFFVDSQLRLLIDLALKNNRDLKVAVLNIERLKAMYQIQRSDTFPKIELSAGANFQHIPEDLTSSGKAMNVEQYNVGLGLVSYELDLFGRVKSLKDQALEQYLATEQAQRSVQISLISEVAISYLTLAADLERLRLANETLVSQQESYKLIQRRFEVGVSSSLDIQQARTALEAARVDIARYKAITSQDINVLTLIIGSQLPKDLLPTSLSDKITAVTNLATGLSSDVLLRRPDILQAEGQLKAANANIGAARAALFPRITLVSSVGLGSDELAGLFKGGSFAWSIAPRISLPIFDGGSNRANLNIAEVDRNIMVARYEKAIQTAFREVADAMTQRSTIDELLTAQLSLNTATAERYNLVQSRFDKGIDNHISVLDSQRSLYTVQQNLISIRLQSLANQVTLYKVLGGGGN